MLTQAVEQASTTINASVTGGHTVLDLVVRRRAGFQIVNADRSGSYEPALSIRCPYDLLGHERARYFQNTDDRGASAEAQSAVGIEAAG